VTAYEEVRPAGSHRILLVCEHASNAVPPEYDSLGVAPADLARHIGWDIGAAALARALADRLDATAILGVVSRLVIDINRYPWHPGFVPASSDGTVVPGNAAADQAERDRRAARWFAPFHERVSAEVDARLADGRDPVLVTVHSFTPALVGRDPRPWLVGVLYDRERRLGKRVLEELRPLVPGPVGDNRPYRIELDGTDYTVPVHGDQRRVPTIAFEVRHDQIDGPEGVAAWCERLAVALERAVS
jgi:predicted N-formylglutamate amidohydrolase